MLSSLIFSIVGTLLLGLTAVGLVYLMASMGGGQRVQATGSGRSEGGSLRRPGRSATQRASRS
jgi:hypothetical protein